MQKKKKKRKALIKPYACIKDEISRITLEYVIKGKRRRDEISTKTDPDSQVRLSKS